MGDVTALTFPDLLTLPLTEISRVLAQSFEGYFVPLPDDPRSLATRFRAEQIDLAASFVALTAAGERVGLCLIARRGNVSRVAAMGIVPAYRGQGVGAALLAHALAEARGRGDSRMGLEVIEQNAPAVRLYEKYGFVRQRRLVGFEHVGFEHVGFEAVQAARPEPLPLLEFAAQLPAELWNAPWQVQPATLAGLSAPAQAFRLGAASAVVTVLPELVVLRALYVPAARRRQGEASRLVQALAAQWAGRRWTVPAIWPEGWADEFLFSQGFKSAELSQWDMLCELT